jgi:hypothetical protein
MAIRSPYRLVKIQMSPEEYKKLNELAKEDGFFMSAYIRNLINSIYFFKHMNETEILESGKLDFGGFGIEFSKEVMANFIQNISDMFKNIDIEQFIDDLNIKPMPPNNYPKTRKERVYPKNRKKRQPALKLASK